MVFPVNSKVKFPRFACATEERNGLLAGLQSMQFKHNDHGKCSPESGVRESRDLLTYRVISSDVDISKPKQHSRVFWDSMFRHLEFFVILYYVEYRGK